jgi:hypothetical protein
MNLQSLLADGEHICWEGRPAPRCFTFRNWRHSIFGILFLLVSTYWQVVGMQIAAAYDVPWLAWLPAPFVILSIYLSLGHHLLARLEWNKVFYAVTDRRLLVRRGLFRTRTLIMELSEITYFQLRRQGEQLGTLRVHGGAQDAVLVLNCIEYPHRLTDLLEDAMGDKACHLAGPEAT